VGSHGGFFLNSTFGEVPVLSLFQKLMLRVSDHVFLRYQRPVGWSSSVPVYVVKCKRHGLYLDTPHGCDRNYFLCDSCFAEKRRC
jgi:hypothetical protein